MTFEFSEIINDLESLVLSCVLIVKMGMKAVIQRVSEASVSINDEVYSTIDNGFLILLGITHDDGEHDIDWLVRKICNMRIFPDEGEKMNLSIKELNGEVLVVSQFTLFASCKKGNRPSFTRSAPAEVAIPLYDNFIKSVKNELEKAPKTGVFGADMQVSLLNNGPVTIILDTKDKE